MEISDELIGCYTENTCTEEERKTVRLYLLRHPEEYERIIYLIDDDIEDYLDEQESDGQLSERNTDNFSDIALSAAAFAAEQQKNSINKNKTDSRYAGLMDRLNDMCIELDQI